MPGEIWVVGEAQGAGLARVSAEVATLARGVAASAGRDVWGVVVAAEPAAAAQELARYLPHVLSVPAAAAEDHASAAVVASTLAALAQARRPDFIMLGATPDGRDVAGMLSAMLGWGLLANAMGVAWVEAGPAIEMSIFGGRLLTTSSFTADHGIVTVRQNVATAEAAPSPGDVEDVAVAGGDDLPFVNVLERRTEAGAAAPIEEARIIVAGGRGVGGPAGFELVDALAEELGGSVGATRAAVDAGWINYAHQIGQTGKVVKPSLYLALGISGAIQHKVGMQTAESIVAVNRDPDAPIAEFADLLVVGDLFEVGPALLAELRARRA